MIASPPPSTRSKALRVVSINVGLPKQIGERRGRPVLSGIDKRPTGDGIVTIDIGGIAGDGQADLRVHGGADKAVYAYPSEHLPAWQLELGQDLAPGAFGENLTTVGATEQAVSIGDLWSWGSAILQVCQPRFPCFKLGIHRNRADMIERFLASGRSGWYLRVLQPGHASVGDEIGVIERPEAGFTVLETSRAVLPGGATADQMAALLAISPLAASWKAMIQCRLDAEHQ